MSRRTRSGGDRGKALVYVMSHRDDSSDDETASAGEQSTQVLQSHFDHGANATRPADGMLMETQSRR